MPVAEEFCVNKKSAAAKEGCGGGGGSGAQTPIATNNSMVEGEWKLVGYIHWMRDDAWNRWNSFVPPFCSGSIFWMVLQTGWNGEQAFLAAVEWRVSQSISRMGSLAFHSSLFFYKCILMLMLLPQFQVDFGFLRQRRGGTLAAAMPSTNAADPLLGHWIRQGEDQRSRPKWRWVHPAEPGERRRDFDRVTSIRLFCLLLIH